VRLFGRDYSIKGHGNRNYLQKVAEYISEKSQTIQRQTEVVSTLDLAVLTLLNIADEMFQYKEANERTMRELEGKNRQTSHNH
jgi:cell division protein ZapA